MKQNYEEWRPLQNIPRVLWVEGFYHDWEGLRLLLRDDSYKLPMLRLKFSPYSIYRYSNESYRLRTWSEMDSRGLPNPRPTLMTVNNSQWLEYLLAEAAGMLELENLTHYAIYTGEDCFDVVSDELPVVEWLGPVK